MRKVVILFFLGWAVVYADRTVLYPLLPAIGEQFQLSNTQAGALASTYFLPYVVMQIPSGFLGDRWGHRRVLVVFFTLAGLSLLALGLASTNYILLSIWVGLHGVGAGAFFATAYGFTMTEASSNVRGLTVAIINSGMGLGLIVGLAMAGPVYTLTKSWQVPFVILALPTLILAIIFSKSLSRKPQQTRVDIRNISKHNISLLPLYAAFFCSIYAFWVVVTWGPSYLYRERGLDISEAGLFIGIIAIVAIPAAIVAGKISDRFGRKVISLVLLPLAAVSILSVAAARSWALLLGGLLLYGLVGKLTWDPIVTSWVGDQIVSKDPESRGTAMGLLNFSGMLSAVVAPSVSGWITDKTGSLESAFYFAALLLLVGMILVIGTREVPT